MLYATLCYPSENELYPRTQEQDDAVLAKRTFVTDHLAQRNKLGAAVRLMPTRASMTVHGGLEPFVVDRPFAETKEQLLGLYFVLRSLRDVRRRSRSGPPYRLGVRCTDAGGAPGRSLLLLPRRSPPTRGQPATSFPIRAGQAAVGVRQVRCTKSARYERFQRSIARVWQCDRLHCTQPLTAAPERSHAISFQRTLQLSKLFTFCSREVRVLQ